MLAWHLCHSLQVPKHATVQDAREGTDCRDGSAHFLTCLQVWLLRAARVRLRGPGGFCQAVPEQLVVGLGVEFEALEVSGDRDESLCKAVIISSELDH